MAQHLSEEILRWKAAGRGWQEREHAVNCWLMGAALCQTICDYQLRGSYRFERAAKYFGAAGGLFYALQKINNALVRVRNRLFDKQVAAAENAWMRFLCSAADALVDDVPAYPEMKEEAGRRAETALSFHCPPALQNTRIKLPSAFRSQDLTHYDVLRLADDYITGREDRNGRVCIIGVRTTGSYLAPLLQAYLQRQGFNNVSFVTVRPMVCVGYHELSMMRQAADENAVFLLLDEPDTNGEEFGRIIGFLNKRGVPNERIAVAFPTYPGHNRWKEALCSREFKGIRCYTLSWNRWHQMERLRPGNVRKTLEEYFYEQGMQVVSVEESNKGRATDRRFGQTDRVGWRLKQTYSVRLWDKLGRESHCDVLAKSVGWGWFGYHAYIQADRLNGFVPPLFGLRNGLMYQQWIDGKSGRDTAHEPGWMHSKVLDYIFERMKRLPLAEDMTFRDSTRRYYGGEWLCALLAMPYGRHLGRFMRPVIRKMLQKYRTKTPTVIDGNLNPEEWIVAEGRLWKVDFEHHGFGRTQLNVADPLFDLASYIFGFRLNREEREACMRSYRERTGETRAAEKVALYLWLIAHYRLQNEAERLVAADEHQRAADESSAMIGDREYMHLYSAEYFSSAAAVAGRNGEKHRTCFVIDIENMIDRTTWDFPALTFSSVQAIDLLLRNGFRIFIDSAMPFSEVKAYCDYFGLEGGAAELGSVIWNRVKRQKKVLLDREALERLEAVRGCLNELPGVYIDPRYRYLIKAFAYRGRNAVPLESDRIQRCLDNYGGSSLKVLQSPQGTIVMARGIEKAAAVNALFKDMSIKPQHIIEVAESSRDIPLLAQADLAFVPQFLIDEARRTVSGGTVVPVRRGTNVLSAAARSAVKKYGDKSGGKQDSLLGKNHLLLRLLSISDRPKLLRLFS